MPDRRYAMTRLRRGSYLLPSNDAQTLWHVYSYEEDGSAEYGDGTKVVGTFWATARRRFPRPGELVDLDDANEWEHWSLMHRTRQEAVEEALRV